MNNIDLNNLKIAIVHDILDRYGGAERVLEALLEAFPNADLFVSRNTHNPQTQHLQSRLTGTTLMQKLPFFAILAKFYTPLYPIAFENLDLSNYQIVISSTAHFAKGVISRPNQLHICYCHTPPRFLYHYPTETPIRNKGFFKPFTAILDHLFRQYDYIIAQRPDYFVTNSQNTAKRIEKFYKRKPTVIYPPVNIEHLIPSEDVKKEDYYLVAGRLVQYKNFEMIVDAFNLSGKRLIIVGDGALKEKLMTKAKPNITSLGYIDNQKLTDLYQKAKAFIIATTDEDFGITAIEALAAGTPVIGFDSGGTTETISNNVTGILYSDNNPHSLNQAVEKFEKNDQNFDSQRLIAESRKYSKARFIDEITQFVGEKYPLLNDTTSILE